MSRSSTIAARCAALNTSIAQASIIVIPDISSFARQVREARTDLNAINNDLQIIRTGLGVAQDDFSTFGSKLPTALVEAFTQILDSCDDTSERLHKSFLKLSCSTSPKDDWRSLKSGVLITLRQDLEASRIVLDLAVDYLSLFGRTDTIDSLDSLIESYVSGLTESINELLKRTDMEEIHVNQLARERLKSLLQAVRLLRSCITALSRESASPISRTSGPERRTTTPRPDSLEPSLGEPRRSGSGNGRDSPSQQSIKTKSSDRGIGAWLADVPCHQDEQPLTHSMIIKVTEDRSRSRSTSHSQLTPSRGTFYTDDGVSSSPTLVAPESRESRIKKSRSWCSEASTRLDVKTKTRAKTRLAEEYSPTVSSSDVSIIHKRITSDKIAVAKGNRKNLDIDSRIGVDRILANIPSDATSGEVERVLWEGANPMVAHPEFGFFFIRAAHDMSSDILRVLMEYGADITRTSSTHYYSAMHAAVLGGQLEIVKSLTSLGHSIDATNTLGETPLHLAARTPGLTMREIAKFLADKGADVNHEANDGNTPLKMALTAKRLEGRERSLMIELLLSYGAEGKLNQNLGGRRSNSKGLKVMGMT
ncbi:ankyrin repeat domain-containing protein 52 [Stagonosporopsis vannaccii]|nr:ankyrin repeat domain-containing protein 52 [Stagonosporopsis vannaccii]